MLIKLCIAVQIKSGCIKRQRLEVKRLEFIKKLSLMLFLIETCLIA